MEYGVDPDALLSHEIVINKLNAAKRKLEWAVTMFSHEWDVAAQHTPMSAAHGIPHDFAR